LPPTQTCACDGAAGLALITGAAGRIFTMICASVTAVNERAITSIMIIFKKNFFIKIVYVVMTVQLPDSLNE
jgi:hypothetical protein